MSFLLYMQLCLIVGDGVIDEEEFEFTLNDGFDVSPKDCQVAYRMMTQVCCARSLMLYHLSLGTRSL